MNRDELSAALYMSGMKYNYDKARRKAVRDLFDVYCSDVAKWAVRLSEKVKANHLIGRHPFMLGDCYSDKRDVAAAVLLSAVIPVTRSSLSKRIEAMRSLIGDSPYLFIKGGYKVKNFPTMLSYGCSSGTLQQWCSILNATYRDIEPSEENMVPFLKMLKDSIHLSELNLTANMKEGVEEALFWLSEGVYHIEGEDIPVPLTKSVKAFLRAYVPRINIIGNRESVDLFGFAYPAMVWYAAQGRELLFKTNYDDMYHMEHNLSAKFHRNTEMSAKYRREFRQNILSKVEVDVDLMGVE